MTLAQTVVEQFPIIRANGRSLLDVETEARRLFIYGFTGVSAVLMARRIDSLIGPDEFDTPTLCIPFVTRGGILCTLYGGWIHASQRINWDVLTTLPDGYAGCLDQIDNREFRDGAGLEGVPTLDMVRILRNL